MLGATVLLQAALLWPELGHAVHPLNDDAFHIAAALRVRQALIERPATAIDPWFSYWSLGYPVLHAYQPLAHVATAAISLLAAPARLPLLFQWLKLLLLLAFPPALYLAGRWLELGEEAALGAALVAPLVATESLFGLEYGSYLWRGSGLYSQLWAMPLLPLALARTRQALRGAAGPLGAALLLAATFLAHSIYGYVAVVSLGLSALLLLRPGWREVLRRATLVLALAGAWVAFFVVPMLADVGAINHSRWEPAWKWDSFGARWVLARLARGELFDHGRLPILTVLLAAGLVLALRRGARGGERFVGVGFLFWLAVYFGRPTWGGALALIGASRDLPLHRILGAVHVFGLLLAGLALGRGAAWLAQRGVWARRVVPAAVLLVLLPAGVERGRFVRQGLVWLERSEAAVQAAAADLGALHARLAELQVLQPGRIYPGLAAQWGGAFKVGEVRVYDFLSLWQLDAVAFLFHAMSLPSDVMVEFDENRLADYDALDVRYVVMDGTRRPAPFLHPIERIGRFALYGAPSTGRVGIGRLGFAVDAGRDEAYGVSSRWLKSELPARRIYGLLGRPGSEVTGLPLLGLGDPLPGRDSVPPTVQGSVGGIHRDGDDWTAELELTTPALVLLKETFHPGWEVRVDGREVPTLCVTPGFVGAQAPAGRHHVAFRYRPGRLKMSLLVLGPLASGLGLAARRRRGHRA